jgi:hypothetical protein
VTCPFCESADVEEVSQWGGQIITRQLRCRACGSYFEAIREEFAAADGGPAGPGRLTRPPSPPPPAA